MNAPRIPRHRPAVITCRSTRWYEITQVRAALVVAIALAGLALWAALAAWLGQQP